MFLERAGGNLGEAYKVKNCPPSCFFLDANSRCAIHAVEGHAAKPETCRLFPFNYLRWVDGHLVVAPHLNLCPLRVVDGEELSEQSLHEVLFEGMVAQGVGASLAPAVPCSSDVAGLFRCEEAIVELAERYKSNPDYMAFACEQQLVTAGCSDVSARNDEIDRVCAELEAFRNLVCRVLAAEPEAQHRRNPDIVKILVAATPVLRAELVLAPPSRLASGFRPVDRERIPRLLVVLHLLTALAREAGMIDIQYQSVLRIFLDCRPLLEMLAYSDCQVVWAPTAQIDWPTEGDREWQARYLTIVKALLPGARGVKKATLGQVLDGCAGAPGVERMLFLRDVATRLFGRIAPVREFAGLRGRRLFQRSLQRWGLRAFGRDVLLTLAESRAGRRSRPNW
jgi:hypothetical protein